MPTPRDTELIKARLLLSKKLQSDGELQHQPNAEMSGILSLTHKKILFLLSSPLYLLRLHSARSIRSLTVNAILSF